jgi:hypothetical protein
MYSHDNIMDELNKYLEYTCVRCNKGTCVCSDRSEQSQELPHIAPIINDNYIEQFNDWD